MELIIDIQKIYSYCFHQGLLKSSFFLYDNNQTYIITLDNELFNPVKIFNFKGEFLKDISELIDSIDFIDYIMIKNIIKIKF